MVLRQRFWIDRRVQGVLIGRVILYWIVAVTYVGLGAACSQFYEHPTWSTTKHATELFAQAWPWIPSLILFVPLVMYDIVRLSNLFAGPIYRLKQHLAELSHDASCRPLSFREDDYWKELAEPINALQTEILLLREELSRAKRPVAATSSINEQRTESGTLTEDHSLAPVFTEPSPSRPSPVSS